MCAHRLDLSVATGPSADTQSYAVCGAAGCHFIDCGNGAPLRRKHAPKNAIEEVMPVLPPHRASA